MASKDQILKQIHANPGLTDRELTSTLLGPRVGQQVVNQAARALAAAGLVVRRLRQDGKIGNYPSDLQTREPTPLVGQGTKPEMLSEDDVKRNLQVWLESTGWQVCTVWGKGHGIDLDAKRNGPAMDY